MQHTIRSTESSHVRSLIKRHTCLAESATDLISCGTESTTVTAWPSCALELRDRDLAQLGASSTIVVHSSSTNLCGVMIQLEGILHGSYTRIPWHYYLSINLTDINFSDQMTKEPTRSRKRQEPPTARHQASPFHSLPLMKRPTEYRTACFLRFENPVSLAVQLRWSKLNRHRLRSLKTPLRQCVLRLLYRARLLLMSRCRCRRHQRIWSML